MIKMNKEKIQNKDVFVADFAGYLIDFIMKLFRIIFKGKEISRQGAHAFALFILTVSILYPNTTFPDNLIGFLKIYGVSFLFFSYFMIDALQNFDRIDRILRKFQQKTDLAYEDIINDVVTGDELANLLNSTSFSCEQLKEIINHLEENNQFTRLAQYNLLLRSNDFTIKTDNYIQELLTKHEENKENEENEEKNKDDEKNKDGSFDSLAICTYVENKKFKLNDSIIKNFYEIYINEPSVIFTIGRYHHYIDVDDFNKKYLTAGKNIRRNTTQKIFIALLKIFVIVPLIWSSIQMLPVAETEDLKYTIISLVVFIIGAFSIEWINTKLNVSRIKKSLKNQKIDISTINIEKFIDDVTYKRS